MEMLPQITQKLRHPDNEVVLRAVEALRAQGWLENGALEGLNLQYVHLQKANLSMADLRKVNLSMADLRWANLVGANLGGAQLNNANLYRADMSMTNLQGANMIRANLQGAHNLTEEQLTQVNRLRGATMPDGSLYDGRRYDGRFNLPGDLADARFLRVDCSNLESLADFYGISMDDYLIGQQWALENRAARDLIEDIRRADMDAILARLYELENWRYLLI